MEHVRKKGANVKKYKMLGLLLAVALTLGACSGSDGGSSGGGGGGSGDSGRDGVAFKAFIAHGTVTAVDAANGNAPLNGELFGNAAGGKTGEKGKFDFKREKAAELMSPELKSPAIIKFTVKGGFVNNDPGRSFNGELHAYLLDEPAGIVNVNFASSLLVALLPNPANMDEVLAVKEVVEIACMGAAARMGVAVTQYDVFHGNHKENTELSSLAAMILLFGEDFAGDGDQVYKLEETLNHSATDYFSSDLMKRLRETAEDPDDPDLWTALIDAIETADPTDDMKKAFWTIGARNLNALDNRRDILATQKELEGRAAPIPSTAMRPLLIVEVGTKLIPFLGRTQFGYDDKKPANDLKIHYFAAASFLTAPRIKEIYEEIATYCPGNHGPEAWEFEATDEDGACPYGIGKDCKRRDGIERLRSAQTVEQLVAEHKLGGLAGFTFSGIERSGIRVIVNGPEAAAANASVPLTLLFANNASRSSDTLRPTLRIVNDSEATPEKLKDWLD